MSRHPKVAAALLRLALRRADRDAVVAELNAEYAQFIRPTRTWFLSRGWYWRQVIGSIFATLAERSRFAWNEARPISGLLMDVRDARRGLVRAPGFSTLVVITLTLGIGTTAAVFSVLDAVILRPLPYTQPERLVRIWPEGTVSKAVMEQVFESTSTADSAFSAVTGYYETRQAIDAHGEAAEALGLLIDRKFFSVLGAAPTVGPGFSAGPAGDIAPSDDEVVISHGLWQRQFEGRADIVGQPMGIGGQVRIIVGVMPATHRPLVRGLDFWLPMPVNREDFSDYQGVAQVVLLGRLADGQTLDAASAQIDAFAQRTHTDAPESYSDAWAASARPRLLQSVMVHDVELAVWMVMGAVGLLLLIACANVANLLMVRSASRRGDVAVRVGMGATPWRIIRLRLTEGALLGAAGGALGALLAVGLVRIIRTVGASALPLGDRIDTNGIFLAFTCLATLVATLLASVGPAVAAARSRPASLLSSGGRGAASLAGAARINRAIVGLAVALAVILVIGSTLMLRTVMHLRDVNPGFRADNVMSLRVRFPDHGALADAVARGQFLDDVTEALERIPGAESASAVAFLPMATGTPSATYKVKNRAYPADVPPPSANFQLVVGAYPSTMGFPLRRGRWLSETDVADSEVVGVINETLARAAFDEADPLGETITMFGGVDFRVVGVVGDSRQRRPSDAPAPEAFFAYRQLPFWPGMYLTVRTSGRVPTAAELRSAVAGVHPAVPVSDVRAMTTVVQEASSEPRLFSRMLSAFGVLALLLGSVGIYGLVSQDVNQRLAEFSIRLALGASRHQVVGAALAHALLPCLIGVVGGTLISAWITRALSGLLFGVSPIDAPTFIGVPLLLLTVALMASYLPARKAALADPAGVLR